MCLLAVAGTANAMGLVSNDGSNVKQVSATISTTNIPDDTVTISVAPGQPEGWISKVGYNVPSGITVKEITDNNGNTWEHKGYQPMFNGMQFNEYDISHQDHAVTSVTIVFDGPITTSTPTFAAHVQWGSGSAFFGPGGSTSIPEFPSIALPIAAIMGIMFIVGRRRKE